MRVLLISHTCQSKTEGQPKAEFLAQNGDIELMVLTPERWKLYGSWRGAERPERPRYTYRVGAVRCPWFGPAQHYLHTYTELPRIFAEFRPDIIDLWEEPWGLVSGQAVSLRNKLLPQSKIITETEQNINKQLPFPFEHLRAFTLRNADFAVGRNSEAITVLRDKGYCGPTAIVPNAVDPRLFRPLDREACRKALGLDGFVVGYVGRLVALKGLIDLVDALPLCADAICLLFVGSGPLEAEIIERSRQVGVEHRVRLLPARPLESLPEIINGIDVLALPSRTTARGKEQFGRVIIEAHACGTPVIGSSSGAIPDVVGHGGLIVPERSPAALAAAMNSLHANPSRCQELGQIGKKQVEDRYTWQRVADQMAHIYRDLFTN